MASKAPTASDIIDNLFLQSSTSGQEQASSQALSYTRNLGHLGSMSLQVQPRLTRKTGIVSVKDWNSLFCFSRVKISSTNFDLEIPLMSDAEPKPSRRRLDRTIVEQEIASCDGDLIELEKAVVAMKCKRMSLNTKLNSTSPFLSTLPVNVISEIFYFVNESQDRKNFCQLPPPFLLGRICKTWREIALSRPRLWSIIVIRFALKLRRLEDQERLLREWIKRSGTHTLSFYIEHDGFEMPPSLAQLIMDCAPRWKSFKCNSDMILAQLSCSDGTSVESSRSFPQLASLYLSLDLSCNDAQRYSFGSTPQLRHVTVSGATSRNLSLNWTQLTTLTASVHAEEAVKMIKLLKDIQHLCLDMSRSHRDYLSSSTSPHILLHLASLKITGNSVFLSTILRALSTPACANLSIHDLSNDRESFWSDQILALHKRAPFPLKALKFRNLDIPEEELVSLLYPFTHLVTLSLDGYYDCLSDTTIRLLDPTPVPGNPATHKPFLPALQHFTYFNGEIDFQSKTMIRMLEQRLLLSQNYGPGRVEALHSFDITYSNMNWSREGDRVDPNRLQDFYRDIMLLANRGSTLKLVWARSSTASSWR